MKTSKNRPLRLLVLIPHRDVRRQLRSWSASLFAGGLDGAWSFPWVAPLAELSSPLSSEELKCLARSLRQEVNLIGKPEVSNSSRIVPLVRGAEAQRFFKGGDQGIPVVVHEGGPGSETLSIYGPRLDIKLPYGFFDDTGGAVVSQISPLVIGCAVVPNTPPFHIPNSTFPSIPFRAAALANMSYRVIHSADGGDGYSFEWKIGALHWLPKRLPPIMHPRD